MTARHLFVVCLSLLMVVVAGTVMHAQDAVKTNEAAAEELQQEQKAAAVVTPAAAPLIEELQPAPAPKAEAVAVANPDTVEAPAQEAVEPKAVPEAGGVTPVKGEDKTVEATPVIEELAPAKVEAKAAEPVPVIEDLTPAKAPEAVPAAATPAVETPSVVPVVEVPKVQEAASSAVPVAPSVEAGAAVKAFGAPEREVDAKIIADMEVVRREAHAKEAKKNVAAADKAWKDKDYAAALTAYDAAAKLGAVRDADRARAQERIPVCEYQVALGMMKAGRTADALARATDASNRYPNDSNLRKLKMSLERDLATSDKGAKGKPAVSSEQRTEVQTLMMDGKKALVDRNYAKARASFESVLAVDRDNREAMRYLKETGDRQFNSASYEREATAKKMTAQVRDTWNPAQYKLLTTAPVATNKPEAALGSESIMKKMERIVIPEIEFRQANIHDVVDFLNKSSAEADKSEQDPAKKGINIILNLNPAGGATVSAPAAGGKDPFGGEAEGGAAGAGGGGQSYEITFTARYITLLSAMKIITQVAGLRYRVDGNIVMIVPSDYDPAQIEVRMYPVEPTFIERVGAAGSAVATAPTATKQVAGRDFQAMDGGEVGGQVADLKESFEKMGVRFPKGSSITYNSGIGKVIVGNTAENLLIFEKLLMELNVVPKQVEIEARFVEVNETDLQELGLEWLLNDDWELATKNTGAFTPLAASQRVVANKNTTSGGFTSGLRFWGTGTDNADDTFGAGQGTMGKIASISGILTNPQLSVVLHALEQNGNADLLSAPKVTTRSGAEASIRVVTEYIYPTTFDSKGGEPITGASGIIIGYSPVVVLPADFATREVGVILTVLPEVSPDGNMINLTMTPSVVTEPLWYQYGSTTTRNGETVVYNMPQPFFKVRTLSTQISIYDGATVVMGGLITEDLRKVNDKIPLLGDIPLIGFLFRSQSERSIKKNLLIFVTAKLVDPAGKPIRSTDEPSSKPVAPPAMAAGGTPASN